MNDVVIIDSREKPRAISKIIEYFDKNEIKHISSKLYCGDYQMLSNGKIVVDRKQHLTEVCGNLIQDHKRFKAEALRAQEAGIKLIILVEDGVKVKSIDDVESWVNPRRHLYCKKYGISTKGDIEAEIKEFVRNGGTKPPTSGPQLAKTMRTMTERYGIQWEFCRKADTGKRIIELLQSGEHHVT